MYAFLLYLHYLIGQGSPLIAGDFICPAKFFEQNNNNKLLETVKTQANKLPRDFNSGYMFQSIATHSREMYVIVSEMYRNVQNLLCFSQIFWILAVNLQSTK